MNLQSPLRSSGRLPRVMVGGPVRNRAWSIDKWLGGLLSLDYPVERLHLHVLVNDSTDATERYVRWWLRCAREEGWRGATCDVASFGTTADQNDRRLGRDYAAFARARDAWCAARNGAEWLLQVDSDIQVPADLLADLLRLAYEHDARMVAAVIGNSAGSALEWYTNVMQWDPERPLPNGARGGYVHDHEIWRDRGPGLRPCALTGAVALIHHSVYDAGARYLRDDVQEVAEDAVFCEWLRAHGVQPYAAPSVRATHWMEPPADLRYLDDADWRRRLAEFHAEEAAHAQAS